MEELTPNTRYEKFLSAAAGSGSVPDPVTREEKFLKAIADNAGGGGSSLPTDPAQDGTYNLQNTVSSGTGTLSWASGSSGGVLVVHVDGNNTFDKTWQEVHDAFSGGVTVIAVNSSGNMQSLIVGDGTLKSNYFVTVASQENWPGGMYITSSTDDYPYRA